MVNHSYECVCGLTFDRIVKWDQRYVKCECGKRAERSWQSKRARRFAAPIVLHRYADGQYGVPGDASAPTPRDAERIECWNIPEYERALAQMNKAERSKMGAKHEEGERKRDEQMQKVREEIKFRMREASSEWERDMLAVTLERSDNSYRPFEFREFYNEALEGR